MIRVLSRIKNFFVPRGRKPLRIRGGVFAGLFMDIDLQSQAQLYLGLFEREVAGWLQKLSQGIETAIDVGAADGEYTLYFLRKTKAAKVFTFEPTPQNQERLMRNLHMNHYYPDDRLIFSAKLVGSTNNETMCSLDALLPFIFFPCMIKIDVDGGEVDILEGARALLAPSQVRWLIETHSKELEECCVAQPRSAGFTTVIIRPDWWRWFIPELRPIDQNRWLIAVKK